MRLVRLGILFVFVAIIGAMVVCRPQWLAENRFLQEFVSSEIVAVLIVVLTITFASVANIHLSLNRLQRRLDAKHRARVEKIRGKVNDDAWMIFWAFVVCMAALLLKGSSGGDTYLVAVSHAISATVLLINILVLHTMYRSIFALVTTESLIGRGKSDDDGQDFTSESPEIGKDG